VTQVSVRPLPYRSVTVRPEVATSGGYSNDIVFVEVEADGGGPGQHPELVLRLTNTSLTLMSPLSTTVPVRAA
jgi:hypothetical protein